MKKYVFISIVLSALTLVSCYHPITEAERLEYEQNISKAKAFVESLDQKDIYPESKKKYKDALQKLQETDADDLERMFLDEQELVLQSSQQAGLRLDSIKAFVLSDAQTARYDTVRTMLIKISQQTIDRFTQEACPTVNEREAFIFEINKIKKYTAAQYVANSVYTTATFDEEIDVFNKFGLMMSINESVDQLNTMINK
ncbi:hypothetical protein [Cytophaga aurantiaca]|uniref:hypothetical protein n=1 Tax=Cytophaga aurantiaca TaxID=29530 RepID=UPI00036E51A7|nr:hypothetical protein [Cytophaga aurantiaca]